MNMSMSGSAGGLNVMPTPKGMDSLKVAEEGGNNPFLVDGAQPEPAGQIRKISKVMTVVTIMAIFTAGEAFSEAPVTITDEQVEAIVAGAPEPRENPAPELKLRLIDFIDCTDPEDPHDFKDQGTSKVVDGPAGRYRETAAHRHAFFAYRFRSAGRDRPVLIVFEYPDDMVRTINFSTHESGLSGRANIDWSLETGVYCGDPYPLSNAMQYHTFVMWPQDEWPALLVGNFHRYGHPAAASRIWVYAIEEPLPPLDVEAPDPENQRTLGHYNSTWFLPVRFHFGLDSPNAIEHMLDYSRYVGVNELSWSVVSNNTWAFACRIPSWDGGDRSDHLDQLLTAMDERGGMGFVAGFFLRPNFTIGGKPLGEMETEELRDALIAGFDQFLDRYGVYGSLKGVALAGQYSNRCITFLDSMGVAADVVAHIKNRRSDLHVKVYTGAWNLHAEYFDGNRYPDTAGEVVARWETSGVPWSDFIGEEARKGWELWGYDPDRLRADMPGLTIYEQLQPDDHRIYGLYAQQPRAMIYHDLDRSQRRSDAVDSPYANIWNNHFEGWYGLNPEVNFWYRKHWVAPDFNPPPPQSQAPLTRALALRDRLAIVPGSWNNRFFGWEAHARRFAREFRKLPPVEMTDLEEATPDTVRVRWIRYDGRRYIALINLTPFPAGLTVDGLDVEIGPHELKSLVDGGEAAPEVSVRHSGEYSRFIERRIARLRDLHAEVGALDARAAPGVYLEVADEAAAKLAAGRPHAADITLGDGLVNELQLRRDILDPPVLTAPRVDSAPQLAGDLDSWPEDASDLLADGGEYLAGHLYFPNSWSGPEDLSARLRLAHDGTTLYVGVEVRDADVVRYEDSWNRWNRTFSRSDSFQIRLSTDGGYLDWSRPASVPHDLRGTVTLPFDGAVETSGRGRAGFEYTCRRTDTGYVVEGTAPLAELGVGPGGSTGFLLEISDVDKTPNLYGAGWSAKQVLLIPHQPNFVYWNDARNCGRLVIGE